MIQKLIVRMLMISTLKIFGKNILEKLESFKLGKVLRKYDEKQYKKIIYATKVFAKENIATEEKFIPHATTWLNQQRFIDYINKPIKDKTLNNLAG
jgi:hypothetical protein